MEVMEPKSYSILLNSRDPEPHNPVQFNAIGKTLIFSSSVGLQERKSAYSKPLLQTEERLQWEYTQDISALLENTLLFRKYERKYFSVVEKN